MEAESKHIFAGRKTLVVTMGEIKSLLSMEECIELQKRVFISHAAGRSVNAPNTWLRLTGQQKWMKLLAGFVDEPDTMGMKVLARFPNNPPGMNIGSLVALFDAADGFPLAIMDGVFFTAIRTGAGGGLSALYCARKDARRLGILGSGVQARYNLEAIRKLLPGINEVVVYSRSEARRQEFAARMQQETGVRIRPVDSVADAVGGVDIIVTATNSPEPVLTPDLLSPGVHIAAMGIKTEIDPTVFPQVRVIGDGVDVARDDGKFSVALKAGLVEESDIEWELGDVILGNAPGRTSDQEVTFFDSSGLAVQDVICARYVYEKAVQQKKGTWIDLGLGEFP